MLNDVHIPPVEKSTADIPRKPYRHAVGDNDANTDRVRDRVPTAVRSDVPEAIYGEPEDRGESFNTLMSAAIVLVTVAVVVGVGWMVFF